MTPGQAMHHFRGPGTGRQGRGGDRMATDQPSVTRNQPGVTRKDFLRGVGAAGAGGLVVGGVAGFFGGRASESTSPATAAASTSKQPIVIGSGVPVTGVYAGDGQQMQRGQQLAV